MAKSSATDRGHRVDGPRVVPSRGVGEAKPRPRIVEERAHSVRAFARGQFLVTQGFQLLAEDKLTPEEWMRYRRAANNRIAEIAAQALELHTKSNGQSR